MTKEEVYKRNRLSLDTIRTYIDSYSQQEIGVYSLITCIKEQLERSVDSQWEELE